MAENRKTTIKDVCRLADVSVSTVSRVINAPDSVKEEKRLAVQAAIQALGYIPNPIARALSGKRSQLIAMVMPNLLNGCIAEMANGALQEAGLHGCDLMLFTSNENPQKEEKYLQIIQEKMVDGAIFLASSGDALDFSSLAAMMPVVLVDRYETCLAVHHIQIDEKLGMRRLLELAKQHKKERISYLAGNLHTKSGVERLRVFKQLAQQEGFVLPPQAICGSNSWTVEAGKMAFHTLWKRYGETDILLCSSDFLAQGALLQAAEMGLSIPDNLWVFGFDNFPSSVHTSPPLSTLAYPHFQMGKMAVRSIMQSLQNPEQKPINRKLPVELVIRNTGG